MLIRVLFTRALEVIYASIFHNCLLGLVLTYISNEIFQEPNLFSAVGIIVGLWMMIGGAIIMRIKGYDEMLKNKKRQTEAGSP